MDSTSTSASTLYDSCASKKNTSTNFSINGFDVNSLRLGECYVMFLLLLLLTVTIAKVFGKIRTTVYADKVTKHGYN